MTTTQTTKNVSPLGGISKFLLKKTQRNGNIVDHVEQEFIELYPAGYTQRDANGEPRQRMYKALYEYAVSQDKETGLYPFGKMDVHIRLEPEDNKYDPNAVALYLQVPPNHSLSIWNNYHMGYIPARISPFIRKNMHMINKCCILKVRSEVHKKYYATKVVLAYGDNHLAKTSSHTLNRFLMILEE